MANDKFKLISSYEANIQLVKRDESKEVIKASSADDEEIIACILQRLRKEENGLAKV